MKHDKIKPTGSTEDIWLEAAHCTLIEQGVEAVRIMPLAKKLNLSRTSFYWYFEDRKALLAALVKRWEAKNTGNLIAQTSLYADTITEAVFNLFDCWIDTGLFDAPLDFAIRNWAHADATLKETLNKADKARIDAIRDMFLRFDYSPDQAETRAHTIYFTQIGYIAMKVKDDFAERLRRMPAYIETYTGHLPTGPEVARFMARHPV